MAGAQKGAMRIGYARISTNEQNTHHQVDALKAASCDVIFEDQTTGTARKRPGLNRALRRIRAGDQLVVLRLDRLGRSLPHLIEISETLKSKGASFVSLTEAIDTSSDVGDFFFKILGVIAEFERKLIAERTRAGLAAARSRGTRLGRRRQMSAVQVREAAALMRGGMSAKVCAARYGVGRSTLYRELRSARPSH